MNMKRTILFCTILLIMAIGLAACSASASTTPATTAPAATTVSQSTTAGGLAVSMENFSFKPDTLTVTVGATVTWTNNDAAGHDVKSDTFQSPNMAKGQTFSFTFTKKGTYDYICGIHPNMKGKIIVQ